MRQTELPAIIQISFDGLLWFPVIHCVGPRLMNCFMVHIGKTGLLKKLLDMMNQSWYTEVRKVRETWLVLLRVQLGMLSRY